MMYKIFISIIIVLIFASCSNNRKNKNLNHETPNALEDKNSAYDMVSKRGEDDLVESLYSYQVNKNTKLKQFEDKFDNLNKSKGDSTNLFDTYNRKNQLYFSSVEQHISQIKDSILRDEMKLLISNNLTKYNSIITKHKEFLKTIDAKKTTISDLHNILKIVNTLPLIEKYQKGNLPKTKSLEGYINEQDKAIKLADTLIKK